MAPPGLVRRAMKPETAATLLAMMEGVTGPEGTAKRAQLPGIRVGGKTGTAQKLDPRTRTYSNSKYQAWFVGVAPLDDPRLVIVVMLDEPKGIAHTGGAVAAPVFAKVAASQLARLGILTTPSEPDVDVRTARAAPAPQPVTVDPVMDEEALNSASELVRLGDRVLVPDFTDRSVEEVRRQVNGILELVVTGEGRAVAQEPPPGTIVDGSGTRVLVRFERQPGEG
jgi:cell division protein FtsI (penicillin-binding protein 3)